MKTKPCCRGFKMLRTGTAIFVFITTVISCLSMYCNIRGPVLYKQSYEFTNQNSSGVLSYKVPPEQKECLSRRAIMFALIVLASCATAGYGMLKNQGIFLIPFMVFTTLMFGVLLLKCYDSLIKLNCTFDGAINNSCGKNNNYLDLLVSVKSFVFVVLITSSLIIAAIFLHFLMIVWFFYVEMEKQYGMIPWQVPCQTV